MSPSPSSPSATPPLRAWQQESLRRLSSWTHGPFLISAAPGAGKTRPALELAAQLLSRRHIRRVLVLCPTTPLTRQWAAAAASIGVQLAPDATSPTPPPDFHGVALTYARLATQPRRWATAASPTTLLIVDEAHHLGEDLAWGAAFHTAFASISRWLLLSGTPFRSDAMPIPGVRYDHHGLAVPDISYTYAQAVADRICRPVAFVTFDGTLSWRSGEDVIESSFETVLAPREAARRYRTALSTDLPDGLPRILREAHAKLTSIRASGHRDAAALAVAADATHARHIAALIHEATGQSPLLVLHTDPAASTKLARFRHSTAPWIVAVNMVSEGVDIPRLRVGVYASAAKTPLIFRQIVGRFVRTIPSQPPHPSWLYLPAEPTLRAHAAHIESELRHALRSRPHENPEELPDRLPPTEPSPGEQFVPLNAEFAAQMTLFGAPTPASPPVAPFSAAQQPVHPPPPDIPPPEEESPPAAAFERRDGLRRERTRLVADLHRLTDSSHRNINAWLNRSLGLPPVEQATIRELQLSIRALQRELSRKRSPSSPSPSLR